MRPIGIGMSAEVVPAATPLADFAEEVRYYLGQTPRQLPSRFLYDALGSALFDAICHLPWYHISRGELRLLTRYGPRIVAMVDPLARIVELGSGSGEKLASLLATRSQVEPISLHLIDISATALAAATRRLREIPGAAVTGHQAAYEAGLDAVADLDRTPTLPGRTLAIFLGSNIGNFDPPGAEALIQHIRRRLAPGDALLLGADLIKPEAQLLIAYDDPLGVTAAFNRNLLVRINRELMGDIEVSAFAHRAVWHAPLSRIEMHLVSLTRQRLRIADADVDVTLEPGEAIWTESSYKYRPADIVASLEAARFRLLDQWIDPVAQFALTLVEAV